MAKTQVDTRAEGRNQRKAQRIAELEIAQSYWRAVISGIVDEVWLCDLQGRISLINLPAVTQMGLDAFKDKTVHEILDEVDIFYIDGRLRPPEQAPLLRSLKGEIVRGEEIMRHLWWPIRWSHQPLAAHYALTTRPRHMYDASPQDGVCNYSTLGR